MCARFTSDDEGKRVVNENGDAIGIVEHVEAGDVYVNPDPGITDSVKSKLGWGDADEDTYALDTKSAEAITEDEIRIRRL